MFTGLIGGVGEVLGVDEAAEGGVRLTVRSPMAGELRQGDSIAVSGVCLTAVEATAEEVRAEAMAETVRHTTLGRLAGGGRVNLELPLRLGDRLGGHIVQGHVDGVGRVLDVRSEGFSRVVRIEVEEGLMRHIALKGSVAVDGVSLTVSAVSGAAGAAREGRADGESGAARAGGASGVRGAGGEFSVSLIPETLERTTLGDLRGGEEVNVEVDVLSKHVERLMASTLGGI